MERLWTPEQYRTYVLVHDEPTTVASVGTRYADPCHWQTTATTVGPSVDALVAALVNQMRGSTVTPVAVTIDGFSGKEIDLVMPTVYACDGGLYKRWTDSAGGDRYNQGPTQHDLLDILDVGGRTLVIDRVFYPVTSANDRAELLAIFNSLRITP